MASANHQLVQLTAQLGDWRPDVVHAHDWLVAWAGDTLKTLWDVPLVATIHATERGRHGGHLPPGLPAVINAVEWWLTYQAAPGDLLLASSWSSEIVDGFELPRDKLDLVPNGVDVVAVGPAARGCGAGASRSSSPGAGCSTRRASRCWPGRSPDCAIACPASAA